MAVEGQSGRIRVVFKLSNTAQMRLTDGRFVSGGGVDPARLNQFFDDDPSLLVEPVFGPSSHPGQETGVQDQTGGLDNYYAILQHDSASALRLVDDLNLLVFVEEAYIEPTIDLADG